MKLRHLASTLLTTLGTYHVAWGAFLVFAGDYIRQPVATPPEHPEDCACRQARRART